MLLLLLLYLRLLLLYLMMLLLLLRRMCVLLLVSVYMLHRLVHTPRYAHSFEVILQPVSFYPRNVGRSRESDVFRNTTEDADLLVVLRLLPDLCALLAGELVQISFFTLLVLLAALLLDAIPVFAERV